MIPMHVDTKFNLMTVVELRQIARKLKIKHSRLNKQPLIEAIIFELQKEVKKKCCILVIDGLKTKKCENEVENCEKYCKEHKEKNRFEKPDDCPICLEKISEKSELSLTCGHWIHKNCLKLSEKHTCPICRTKMTNRELRFIGLYDPFKEYLNKIKKRIQEEQDETEEPESRSQIHQQNQRTSSSLLSFIPSISRWFGF
jgi:hypothetical protein